MFRNILASTLSNLARNWLYAGISIVGLAVGMAAAILTGLYIRDELTFDRFIPGYRNVCVIISELVPSGRPPMLEDWSPAPTGQQLKMDFKEVQATARVVKQDQQGVRRGNVEGLEPVDWADPDLFSILPLPTLVGDPVATLHRPDGVVITRAIARKYFGQDAPIGQVLELNHTVELRVGAVLKDLPSNTHLTEKIYAAGLNAASSLRAIDARPLLRGSFGVVGRTYVRLANPTVLAGVNAALPAFFARHQALPNGKMSADFTASFHLVPLAALHLYPLNAIGLVDTNVQGSPSVLVSLGMIAVLILAVAGINFVNLMTARANHRAVEVGIRKAVGGRHADLIVQFIAEAVIYALVGLVLAIGGVELVLPWVRTLLDRPLDFAYWRDPALLAAAVGMSLLVGVLGGVYPAFVQSGFRPAVVLKGSLAQTPGSERIRAGLATLQFAFLIGLILAVIVISNQTRYALNEGLRVDKTRMMIMDISQPRDYRAPLGVPPKPLCRDAFPDQVRALPGVLGAACSAGTALDIGDTSSDIETSSGGAVGVEVAVVDYGFLELYGLKPVGGRFFSRDHPSDETSNFTPHAILINEKTARALGYANPAMAAGKIVRFPTFRSKISVPVVGVVPDFAFDMAHGAQRPMVYFLVDPGFLGTARLSYLSIKLSGRDIPETVKAIDALWRRTGSPRPPSHRFVDDYLQTIYVGTLREGYLIDALCGVAVFIASLGLFGLAAFTAERRTKEIGVRKVMGASITGIARLLLWQFSQPVLWANLIAWPLGWWALDRWLHGFARHIQLSPWLFLAASVAALAIAMATVLAHTVRVAGAKPVGALRYE